MVIAKLISGLGNQLFQYTIGRELSLRKGVPLKLDVSFFDSQRLRSYKLHHFNINAEPATAAEVNELVAGYYSTSLVDRGIRKINKLLKTKKSLVKENGWWAYQDDWSNVSRNVYIDGYWQHYKYYENINPVIFNELTLQNESLAQVAELSRRILNGQSVSVHIRRGDYITDTDAYNLMGILPVSYYRAAIAVINSKVQNPVYFFFSDDMEWVKQEFGDIRDSFFVEGCKDYEDLTLMSQCKHNIIANSSFSWWGAFLNRNVNKLVIAPKQWVVPDNINNKIEIQFPQWIKL